MLCNLLFRIGRWPNSGWGFQWIGVEYMITIFCVIFLAREILVILLQGILSEKPKLYEIVAFMFSAKPSFSSDRET